MARVSYHKISSTFSPFSCYNLRKESSKLSPLAAMYAAERRCTELHERSSFPCAFICFIFLCRVILKEDTTWQLRQPKDRDTSRAGPLNERVSLPRKNGFPGDKQSLLACNMCWLCSELQSWLPSLWASTLIRQSSSPVLAHSFSSLL